MKISIVTVCYNAEKSIEATIQSVLEQTYIDIEYIIIDGKSTDRTVDIISKYLDNSNILFVSEKDTGIYNAMNKGIAKASGKYIYFLNAGDTLYEKNTIEKVESEIKNDKNTIYYGMIKTTSKIFFPQIGCFAEDNKELERRLLMGNVPCHQSIFAPVDSLKSHHFDEKYRLRADYEWVMYSYFHEWNYKSLPFIIANYDYDGVSSNICNRKIMQQETLDILKKYELFGKSKQGDISQTNISEPEKKDWEEMSNKHLSMFMLMNKWLCLYQQKKKIESYFVMHGIKNIAIYGMGYIGERLLAELQYSSVNISYLIDKKTLNKDFALELVTPTCSMKKVDAIIVTSNYYYKEIKEELCQLINYPIFSIEEIINELL